MKYSNLMFKLFMIMLIIMSFFFSVMFLESVFFDKAIFIEWEILNLNCTSVVMSMIFDWMSLSFLMVVTLISSMIMGYSIYYMDGDKNPKRFVFILLMFIFSMMFLIISPNLISLLLGWDGLGLTSYALVIFYQNESSCNSGMITILSNRVGDSALLVGIGLMFYKSSWNFFMCDSLDLMVLFFIVLAAMTKSAQIPFSAWLPAAMAAPTPVSALVHSSTLVTAGVYLLIRFSFFIDGSYLSSVCFFVGVLTMFMAGWVANFENDFKKVIALSTLSQLGLMFMIIGLCQSQLAYFHLVMHALFKSTLFMCAGFVIHNMKGSQDGRYSGIFNFGSPVLGILFSVTNLALCGFPFLAGFYSKDLILENSITSELGVFMILMIILSTGLTVSYSLRVFFFSISNKSKTFSVNFSSDFSFVLMMSTFILFMMSISGGFFFSWLMMWKGVVSEMWGMEKFYILFIIFFALFCMINFLTSNFLLAKIKGIFFWFSNIMMFLPLNSTFYFPFFFLKWGGQINKDLDKGWLEYYGPLGLSSPVRSLSDFLQKSQLVIFLTQYILILFLLFFLM
uniref:NADH-ubiquinone oxidoreductase chain 5 n=1 Tax=Grandidierella rubroantennata TaxID=2614733 RepID=A0A5H2YB56_9CRUS|nr:NADH dehydrogenase subunit 5 [Grandidierella rubroantennata]